MNKLSTLKELVDWLESGHTMEDIECNMEGFNNEVYDDGDFDEFFENFKKEYHETHLILEDDNYILTIPSESFSNRHGDDLHDETIYYFDQMTVQEK